MSVATSPSASDLVALRLRGGGFDWRSYVLHGAMLLAMLIALGILIVLLADVASRALPVLTGRPVEFLTSDLSSRPARAGIAQGLVGSLLLVLFVAILFVRPAGLLGVERR